MRICIVTESYIRGGIDTFLISLINGWPLGKDEFTIYINSEHLGTEYIAEKIDKSIKIITYKNFTTRISHILNQQKSTKGKLLRYKITSRLLLLYESTFFLAWRIIKDTVKFRKSDFDRLLVVNGGYPGGLNCRSALIGWKIAGKKPLGVMNFHSYYTKPRPSRILLESISNILVAKSIDTLVSVSKDCLESLSNEQFFRTVKFKQVIYNGIADPGDAIIRKSAPGLKDHSYCIMIGSYEKHKGHNFLLKAFHIAQTQIPNLKLLVYGDGDITDLKKIETEIQNSNLENQVELYSFNDNVKEVLRNSSILLVPSQGLESFGLTIIEAMSMRIPVVATNVGGIPEVLGDNCGGYICSKDDPAQFASRIVQIISDPDLAVKIGDAGRKRFEEIFTNHKMSEKYSTLLHSECR